MLSFFSNDGMAAFEIDTWMQKKVSYGVVATYMDGKANDLVVRLLNPEKFLIQVFQHRDFT